MDQHKDLTFLFLDTTFNYFNTVIKKTNHVFKKNKGKYNFRPNFRLQPYTNPKRK